MTPSSVRLSGLVPGDASLMLLVRMDRVRKTPYATGVISILSAFYDYRMLVEGSGLSPVKDFSALLIATPNPYRLTRTFLAARHRLSSRKLQAALERSAGGWGKTIAWSRGRAGRVGIMPSPPRLHFDPRRILLRRGLLLLVDPKQAPALLRREPLHQAPVGNPAATGQAKGPRLVDRLMVLQREGGGARRKRGPALLIQAENLGRLVRLPRGFPMPQSLRITATPTDPARIRGRLAFANRIQAQSFLREARRRTAEANASIILRLMGVTSLLGELELRLDPREPTVLASMDLGAAELNQLLGTMRSFIPQVPLPPRNNEHPTSKPTSKPVAPAAGPGGQ